MAPFPLHFAPRSPEVVAAKAHLFVRLYDDGHDALKAAYAVAYRWRYAGSSREDGRTVLTRYAHRFEDDDGNAVEVTTEHLSGEGDVTSPGYTFGGLCPPVVPRN